MIDSINIIIHLYYSSFIHSEIMILKSNTISTLLIIFFLIIFNDYFRIISIYLCNEFFFFHLKNENYCVVRCRSIHCTFIQSLTKNYLTKYNINKDTVMFIDFLLDFFFIA